MKKSIDKKLTLIYLALSIYIYFIFFITNKYDIFPNAYLFFYSEDRFADLNKIIFSFRHIFDEISLINLKVPKEYIVNNPYSLLLKNETTLVMASPPLMLLFFLISSYFAKFIGFHHMFLFILYFFIFFGLVIYIFKNEIKNNKLVLSLIFSFPMLFLVDRGNISAAITAVLLYMVINKFLKNKNLTNLDIFFFVLATSFRPNYLIFGLLFVFNKNIKDSLKIAIKTTVIYFSFNILFIYISSLLLPNYSYQKFIFAFREYAFIHEGPWNASAYGALKNLYDFFLFRISQNFNSEIYIKLFESEVLIFWILIFYLFLIFFNHFICFKFDEQKLSYLLVITSGCFLFTHPVADYHLILLSFILISHLHKIDDLNVKNNVIIIFIILLPKPYFFVPFLNFANFINFLLLNYLFFRNILFLYNSKKLINRKAINFTEKVNFSFIIKGIIVFKNFFQKSKDKIFEKKVFQISRLILTILTIGIFINLIFINFFEEEPIQLRSIENACGEYPVNYIKPDISSNPNYVFINDSNYQSRVLWDEVSNSVIVNSFVECEHYHTGGWFYYSKEYYLENQEKICLELDRLKDKDLDRGIVYFKNISLKEFLENKNSLCMGSIQDLRVDGELSYYQILFSKSAYILISQIIPFLFLLYFSKLSWNRFLIILIFYQTLSQFIMNFYIGLNLLNYVSLSSTLAILIIKMRSKNETKI